MKCPVCRFAVRSDVNRALVPNRIVQEAVIGLKKSLESTKENNRTNSRSMASSTQTRGTKRGREDDEDIEIIGSSSSIIMKKKPMPNYTGKNKKKLQELVRKWYKNPDDSALLMWPVLTKLPSSNTSVPKKASQHTDRPTRLKNATLHLSLYGIQKRTQFLRGQLQN